MVIKLIQENKLQITLSADDLAQLGITYEALDYVNPTTRDAVSSLLKAAKRQVGFEPADGRLLIEAYPLEEDGCVLYFTALSKKEKAAATEPVLYEFSNVDLLLEGCCKLYRQYSHRIYKSSAYQMGGRYYLSLTALDSADGVAGGFLLEYSRRVGKGRLAEAYLEEHGNCLAQNNAADLFCRYFGG